MKKKDTSSLDTHEKRELRTHIIFWHKNRRVIERNSFLEIQLYLQRIQNMTPQIGSIMRVLGRLLHENIESGIISADEVTLSTATISERKVLFYLDKVDWQKIGVEQI